MKCDASATADARASASPLAPARASRETRRIATRAIGTASARTLFDVSSRVRFVRFLDSFTNSVVSTRSTRAAKTAPSRGRPAARARRARARARARARGAGAPGPAASPATAWNAPSASQPFSSPASSSSAKTRSGARGRQMRSGSRPSLNPAPSADQSDATAPAALRFPANFRRPPRANEAEPIAEGGTAHARSARRHATTSMGGGACVSLATWPHATYPSLGTGRQKLSVPSRFPARAPAGVAPDALKRGGRRERRGNDGRVSFVSSLAFAKQDGPGWGLEPGDGDVAQRDPARRTPSPPNAEIARGGARVETVPHAMEIHDGFRVDAGTRRVDVVGGSVAAALFARLRVPG